MRGFLCLDDPMREENSWWATFKFRRGFTQISARCWYCERVFVVPRDQESIRDSWYCPRCK